LSVEFADRPGDAWPAGGVLFLDRDSLTGRKMLTREVRRNGRAPGGGFHTMIGKVVFQYKSSTVEAVMDDDGTWRCDAIPCLVRPLNILYSAAWIRAPVDPCRSRQYLHSAALWLHGEVRTEGN